MMVDGGLLLGFLLIFNFQWILMEMGVLVYDQLGFGLVQPRRVLFFSSGKTSLLQKKKTVFFRIFTCFFIKMELLCY